MLFTDETCLPLMIRFRCQTPPRDQTYWYDETQELNVSLYQGQIQPVISLPGSLANLKTVMKPGGED